MKRRMAKISVRASFVRCATAEERSKNLSKNVEGEREVQLLIRLSRRFSVTAGKPTDCVTPDSDK